MKIYLFTKVIVIFRHFEIHRFSFLASEVLFNFLLLKGGIFALVFVFGNELFGKEFFSLVRRRVFKQLCG